MGIQLSGIYLFLKRYRELSYHVYKISVFWEIAAWWVRNMLRIILDIMYYIFFRSRFFHSTQQNTISKIRWLFRLCNGVTLTNLEVRFKYSRLALGRFWLLTRGEGYGVFEKIDLSRVILRKIKRRVWLLKNNSTV